MTPNQRNARRSSLWPSRSYQRPWATITFSDSQESKRELLATKPEEQIACWGKQLEKANIKRSRYQAQETEGLMTRQELRAKLAELDETVALAEAEIEKLRHHEKSIKAMARSYSNATPSSYPNS